MKLNNKRKRVKLKIKGKDLNLRERPCIKVFRSNKFTYALVVNADNKVIKSFTSKNITGKKVEAAKKAGIEAGKFIIDKKLKDVFFDRNGYKYHGRVKAVAEGAREAGVKF